MPNFEKHFETGLMIGATVGAGMELWRQLRAIRKKRQERFDFERFAGKTLASMLLGALGSALPDALEPADTYNHHRFFHSWLTAMGLSVAEFYMLSKELDEEDLTDFIISRIGLGYISHLSLDSETPKGLPFV